MYLLCKRFLLHYTSGPWNPARCAAAKTGSTCYQLRILGATQRTTSQLTESEWPG